MTGQGNLTGSGVHVFNKPQKANDVVNIAGQGSVALSPPSSGLYQGITLFQSRAAAFQPTLSITGVGGMNVTGTFYAPAATLSISGNGVNNIIGSQYISNDLSLGGNGAININWSDILVSRERVIGLVE
jgi:hypothetical protein